ELPRDRAGGFDESRIEVQEADQFRRVGNRLRQFMLPARRGGDFGPGRRRSSSSLVLSREGRGEVREILHFGRYHSALGDAQDAQVSRKTMDGRKRPRPSSHSARGMRERG